MFFVIFYNVISRNLKLEIWLKMCEMACESRYRFIFLKIMSFFPLKFFSLYAKLFVKRRLQFHFSHAENVSSKLPKWTLFVLYLVVHILLSENVSFKIHKQVSSLS